MFLPFGTLEAFRADLGLTYAQAGTVLAAIAPGALVGGVFPAAADRYSRRVIAAGGAFGFAVSLGMFALGGSFAVLAAGAFLMGVSSTAMVDGVEVALVDMAGDDLRRLLARSNLLATIGDLLGPALIAGTAVAGLSWRVAFGVGAALMGLYGVALAAAPLPAPGRAGPPAGGGDEDDDEAGLRRPRFVAVLQDPAVWALGLVGALMVPFDEPLVGFTIALLEQDRGASAAAATVVAFVGIAGGVLAFTVLARRVEGVADDRLLVGAVTAMAAGAVVIVVVPALPVVAVAALVTSVGLNLAWLATQHRSLTMRPGQVGTTTAVLGMIGSSGMWIPMGIGVVADRAGLTAAVGCFALLGVVMVALAVWLGRHLGNPPTTSAPGWTRREPFAEGSRDQP